jgi:hypothetical protein
MLEMTYDDPLVTIQTSGNPPLTELSFCIENAAAYMLGRGVWRMRFSRLYDKDLLVNVRGGFAPKPMTFGLPASLGMMAKDGFFPKTIKTEDFFTIPGQRKLVRDGSHRLVEYSEESTVILTRDMNPDMSLGLLCYGISDFVTGFFYHGVKTIEAQFSLAVFQYKLDKGFDKDWLTKYLLGKTGTDYPVHRNVDSLV